MSKAIGVVRAGEARQMKADGFEPSLTDLRSVLLKWPENLTENQQVELAEHLQYKLKAGGMYSIGTVENRHLASETLDSFL